MPENPKLNEIKTCLNEIRRNISNLNYDYGKVLEYYEDAINKLLEFYEILLTIKSKEKEVNVSIDGISNETKRIETLLEKLEKEGENNG